MNATPSADTIVVTDPTGASVAVGPLTESRNAGSVEAPSNDSKDTAADWALR